MNIYLSTFNVGSANKGQAPTPRLRSMLLDPNVILCEGNIVDFELKKGKIPFYSINGSSLYNSEKKYLSINKEQSFYFCLPLANKAISIDSHCDGNFDSLDTLFGLDPENSEEICLRYVGNIKENKVKNFCSTWDKSFHLLQSIVRVLASNEYDLNLKQKEIFSLSWAKVLSMARIRFKLDCDVDVVDMGTSAPLWLQQFSKGIVILDTTSAMVASSLVTDAHGFLNSSYNDLKAISLSLCKSFLNKAKSSPQYAGYEKKIDEWISVCDKMSKRTMSNKTFPVKVVFGIIGAIILIKKMKRTVA